MPDGTGGVATGVYWVITGKLPAEDLDDTSKEPRQDPSQQRDPRAEQAAADSPWNKKGNH